MQRIKSKWIAAILVLEGIVLLTILISCFGKETQIQLSKDAFVISADGTEYQENTGAFVMQDTSGAGQERDSLLSIPKQIRPGAYKVRAYYSSMSEENVNGGNIHNYAGTIQFFSQSKPSAVQAAALILRDGEKESTQTIWIHSLSRIQDLQCLVHYNGKGTLELTKVVLTEQPVWRVTRLGGYILFFFFLDFLYVCFFISENKRRKKIVLCMSLAVLVSSMPLFTKFLYKGHDLMFHLNRIGALAQGLADGKWIVPIQTEMMNGYGYATPLFYGQLFLYLPAVLYNMAVPLQDCYKIYVLLINIATVGVSYWCIRKIIRQENLALLGAALYTLSAYRISNLYVRGALGEYTAMVFFPVVLYGFYKIYTVEEKKITVKTYLPIVIGLTGLIQCHVLSCELAAICIVAVCLINIKKTLEFPRLLALCKAAGLSVLLNLAFLVPFFMSMQMQMNVTKDEVNKMQNKGAYFLQILGIFHTSSGDCVDGMQHEMPFSLGFSLVLGLLIFLWCCVRKYDWHIEKSSMFRLGIVCTGLAVSCILLATSYVSWDSLEDWNHSIAKFLCTVQFPWRYLALATVFATVAESIGLWYIRRYVGTKLTGVAGAVLLGVCLLSTGVFYMNYQGNVEKLWVFSENETDTMEVGGDEYLLAGTDKTQLYYKNIQAEDTVEILDYVHKNGNVYVKCKNTGEQSLIELPLQNYENYQVYDTKTKTGYNIQMGDNNRLGVLVPSNYQGTLCIQYKIPALWKISYAVSVLTLLFIIAAVVVQSKRMESLQRGKRW